MVDPVRPRRRDPAGATVTGGFLLVGVVAVLLGPAIPELRASWGVTTSQAGSLFVAQFGGSSIGAVFSALHLRRSLIGGFALLAAGLLGLAGGDWAVALPAVAVLGLGLGLLIPAANLYVAHLRPRGRGAALSRLNLVWGVGAVSSPLLFAALGRGLAFGSILRLLALLAVAAGYATWRALPAEAAGGPRPASASDREGGAGLGLLCLLGAMLFLYVGCENAVGGWLVTLSDELAGDRAVVSLLIGSGFWGAILAGRALAPWLLRRLSEPGLYGACLGLAGGGTLLLVLSASRAGLAGGALAAGLGMAPLFPLTISILAEATAATASRTSGWVLACGGLGGAALPWLTGRISVGAEAPGRGFLVPLAALALLGALFAARRKVARWAAPGRARSGHGDC